MSTSDLITTLASLSPEELNAVRFLLDLPFNPGSPGQEPETVIERYLRGGNAWRDASMTATPKRQQ